MQFNNKITLIGGGYVGSTIAAVISKYCPNIKVTVVDIDEDRIEKWNSDNLPFYEPGLQEIIQERRGQNLFFTTDINKSINEADMIFICVNTPTKTYGVGAGHRTDLTYIEAVVRQIAAASDSSKIIVEKSTVPCGTAQNIKNMLDNIAKPGVNFEILSNPEFLSEGTAIKDLVDPSRVLIGSFDTEGGRLAAEILKGIYLQWVTEERLLTIDLWSSELAKIAANAMLAQRISSINSLSALCESTGANIESIAKAVGMDPRIGADFLKPSVGFGGSCFKKDILNLVYMARSFHLNEVADYWEQVLKINDYQKKRFSDKIIKSLLSIKDKNICMFGFAYKKNTSDTRESAAIDVMRDLIMEDTRIRVYDPKVAKWQIKDNMASEFDEIDDFEISFRYYIEVCDQAYDAASGAHILVIMTEWAEFKDLDYQKIYDGMHKPAIIFDGRNILDSDKMKAIGFVYNSIGR